MKIIYNIHSKNVKCIQLKKHREGRAERISLLHKNIFFFIQKKMHKISQHFTIPVNIGISFCICWFCKQIYYFTKTNRFHTFSGIRLCLQIVPFHFRGFVWTCFFILFSYICKCIYDFDYMLFMLFY